MDVHPPTHSVRNWKDFLLHLLTIANGLFIALTLETGVESLHNRNLVRAAHASLRQEIEANHKLFGENARALARNRQQLIAVASAKVAEAVRAAANL